MRIAAVMYEPGEGETADRLLSEAAVALRGRGRRLAGTIQSNEPGGEGRRCDMTLEDLVSRRRICASTHRGSLARGCRLDTEALEEAVGLALSSLTPATDLVIINRFGKREAEGRGFRPLIEAAVEHGVPVLIGVNVAQSEAWYRFTGCELPVLPLALDDVMAWCEAAAVADARI